MDEPGRHGRAGDVFDQPPAPPDRDVLEYQQVDDQGAQVRPDRYRRVPHAGRAGRHVLAPAGAPRPVHVVLDAPGGHQRGLQLLGRAGHAQVLGTGQVRAAHAGTRRVVVVDHLIRLGPAHRRARRARLLAALARRPLRGAALLPRRPLAARQVISRRRHRGIATVAGHDPLQARHRGLQLADLPLLRGDLCPLLGDHGARGNPRSHGHPAANRSQATMIRASHQ